MAEGLPSSPGSRGAAQHVWSQIRALGLRKEVTTLAEYERLVSIGFLAANDYLGQQPDILFDSRCSCIVHWLMFQGVHDWAGQMRGPGELPIIAGFVGAEPVRIEREFLLLREQVEGWPGGENVEWHNAVGFALILAFQHIRFERVHPFRDGNGRVGRLLLTASLRQRFRRTNLYIDWDAQKEAYHEALRQGCGGDLAPLANIILQSCGRASFPSLPFWSPYRVAPRMPEQDRETSLAVDFEWSKVTPAFWMRE